MSKMVIFKKANDKNYIQSLYVYFHPVHIHPNILPAVPEHHLSPFQVHQIRY